MITQDYALKIAFSRYRETEGGGRFETRGRCYGFVLGWTQNRRTAFVLTPGIGTVVVEAEDVLEAQSGAPFSVSVGNAA